MLINSSDQQIIQELEQHFDDAKAELSFRDPADNNRHEFIITVKNFDDLEDIYDELETEGKCSCHTDITRAVECVNRRPISRNTHYFLTDEEAEKLRQDPRILAVTSMEMKAAVKYFPTGIQYSSNWEKTRTLTNTMANWGLLVSTVEGELVANANVWGPTHAISYANANVYIGADLVIPPETGNVVSVSSTITQTSTGKNVDFIAVEVGSFDWDWFDHPEYAVNPDGTGGTRAVKYNWAANHPEVDPSYTNYNYRGNIMPLGTASHAMHVAGCAAGNTHGFAKDANIYNIGILEMPAFSATYLYDYVRAFHRSKPVNPVTGRKNPTVCNNSWYSYTGDLLSEYTANVPAGSAKLSNVNVISYRGTEYKRIADEYYHIGDVWMPDGFGGTTNFTPNVSSSYAMGVFSPASSVNVFTQTNIGVFSGTEATTTITSNNSTTSVRIETLRTNINVVANSSLTSSSTPNTYYAGDPDNRDSIGAAWTFTIPPSWGTNVNLFGTNATNVYLYDQSILQVGGTANPGYSALIATQSLGMLDGPHVKVNAELYTRISTVYYGEVTTDLGQSYVIKSYGKYGGNVSYPQVVQYNFYKNYPSRLDVTIIDNTGCRALQRGHFPVPAEWRPANLNYMLDYTLQSMDDRFVTNLGIPSPNVSDYSMTFYDLNSDLYADMEDAMADGIHIVSAAGNDSGYLSRPGFADYNNYFEFGPRQVGNISSYDSTRVYYQKPSTISITDPDNGFPVIVVGALSNQRKTQKQFLGYRDDTDGVYHTLRTGAKAFDSFGLAKAYFSNYGPGVDVWAPGVAIPSVTYSGNVSTGGWSTPVPDSRNSNYYIGKISGTSMASPITAGLLCCILETYPDLTPLEAHNYIKQISKSDDLTDATAEGYVFNNKWNYIGWYSHWPVPNMWTGNLSVSETVGIRTTTYGVLQNPEPGEEFTPVRIQYKNERALSGQSYPNSKRLSRPTSGMAYPRQTIRRRPTNT